MFVGGFIGSPAMNFFPCEVLREESKFFAHTGDFRVLLTNELADYLKMPSESEVILGIRPEDMRERRPGEEVSSDR